MIEIASTTLGFLSRNDLGTLRYNMAFFDEQIIERIQQATDIVSVVEDYVPLKRAGRSYKACCPFHKEKTPSFIVSPDRQTFHCFGCSVGGDVFSFLMKMDGMNFPEAVRHLANLAHIELPEVSSDQDLHRKSRREKFLGIYEQANRFFQAYYHHEVQGKSARDYMASRQFAPEILKEFNVGFSPPLSSALLEGLKKKGISEEDILASGLVSRTQRGQLLDLFRGRVVFPIANTQGKIVAFGGRVLSDELPKYINSPESEIFKKRHELYSLHIAKKHIDRDDPYIIIVEGYLDVIRLHGAGIRNVVGTLGTALTEEHAQVLKRYVKEIELIFDGDQAGEAASLRGLETFLEQSMSVKLIALPSGYDPDDFVRERGAEAFRELLRLSEDMFSYKLKMLMKRHNPKDTKGLLSITGEMATTLLKVPNAVLLDRYVKQLATILGVEEQSIQLELAKLRDKLSARSKAVRPEQETSFQHLVRNPFQAEYAIISLIVEDDALALQAFDLLSGEDFRSREAAEIFERIQVRRTEGKSVSVRSVLQWELSEAFKSYLTSDPFQHLSPEDRGKALDHCVIQLREKAKQEKLNEIRRQIRQAEQAGNQADVPDLVRQFQDLTKSKYTL